jgi:hypothetical protein
MISEFQKIERGHGFQHADLLIEQFKDFHDPFEFMHGVAHIRQVLVDPILQEDVARQVQFEDDLLEPQLIYRV